MKFLKNHSEFFLILIILAVCGFLSLYFYKSSQITYKQKIFNPNVVHEIKLTLEPKNLALTFKNHEDKIKYHADMIIDDEVYKDISISTRGNASLINDKTVESNKYPLKINFKKYVDEQNYYNLDKLVLDNISADVSFLKNCYAYKIMSEFGVPAPLCSYSEVYMNEEYKGLFLAIEPIDDSFVKRNYNTKSYNIYQPTPLATNFTKIKNLEKNLFDGEEIFLETDFLSENFDTGGADLVFRDENPLSYPAIFENEITNVSPESRNRLIQAIKSLQEENSSFEDYWDIEALAKYFAAHNFILNFDSYTGNTAHNYYVIEQNGKFSLLPWDYDLAFGGVDLDENRNIIETPYLHFSVDNPLDGPTPEMRPLWKRLSESETFMEKYHVELQTFINDYILTGKYETYLEKTSNMIRPYVEKDVMSGYSTEVFDKSIEQLKTFSLRRADIVQKQLWGLAK